MKISRTDLVLGVLLPLLIAVPILLWCQASRGYIPTGLPVALIVTAHLGTGAFRRTTRLLTSASH